MCMWWRTLEMGSSSRWLCSVPAVWKKIKALPALADKNGIVNVGWMVMEDSSVRTTSQTHLLNCRKCSYNCSAHCWDLPTCTESLEQGNYCVLPPLTWKGKVREAGLPSSSGGGSKINGSSHLRICTVNVICQWHAKSMFHWTLSCCNFTVRSDDLANTVSSAWLQGLPELS